MKKIRIIKIFEFKVIKKFNLNSFFFDYNMYLKINYYLTLPI